MQRTARSRQIPDVNPETRFRAVFAVAYAPLFSYARHRGLTGPDAEDLVASTLEIAWRRMDDLPEAEPLPWLYGIAHNLWRNQVRRDGRRRELLARLRHLPPAVPGTESAELAPGALRAALAALSDADQEILRLIAWDGLTRPR